jgi:hypothetical protein
VPPQPARPAQQIAERLARPRRLRPQQLDRATQDLGCRATFGCGDLLEPGSIVGIE